MLNKYGRLTILLALLLLSCATLRAQTDNSKFFDDDDLTGRNNLLKLDVLSFLNGELAFYYEKILNNKFSLEVGAGTISSRFNPKAGSPLVDRFTIANGEVGSGYSLSVNPRLFIEKEAPEGLYTGLQWRLRSFDQGGRTYQQNSFMWTWGIQRDLRKNLLYDVGCGVGLHSEKEKNNPSAENLNGAALSCSGKIVFSF